MTKKIVTCKKCGKIFDYMKTDGVCPKCARYYSTTNYNEEESHHYQNRIDDRVPFFRNAPSRPNKNVTKMAVIVTVAFILFIGLLLILVK